MQSHARVVVIGGGVVGVSALYHLAKKGWSDVVLLERKELTSGSTWHAAGLLPLFNMSYSVGQVHKYSVDFYQELQKETGQDVGFAKVSNIRLAQTQDRMDEYRQYAGVAATIGINVEFLTPKQVKEIWPLCNIDGLVGAIQHPDDGYIQPADLTMALAQGARSRGATIHRNTAVTAITRTPSGEWCVHTDKGTITCEHIISATGSFARQTGAMVGLDIPVVPVEHQYIVTDDHPDLVARKDQGLPELGVLRDSDNQWYMRQEKGGLILGPYEKGAPACYVDGPSAECEYELFQEDLDRLEPHIEGAMFRVPAFGEVGVKKVYNGAICYTPDGNPIIGPAWDRPNFWLSEGHSFGITAAGGAGWQLAEWIVEGEPTIDMLGVDPRRFGDYATKSYLVEKNEEAYNHVFITHYPDEERPAARPLRRTPIYDRLKDLGAVFGASFGWERANFYAPEGMPQQDHWSFRRSNWHDAVGLECKNVMDNVGILDMTGFAKCRISGPGAEAFLDHLVANKLPKKIGRLGLAHSLSVRGGVHSEFTILREEPDYMTGDPSFYIVSAGAYQRLDHDWIKKHMPTDGSVRFDSLTNSMGVLVIAGPKARTLMQRVSPRTDFSNKAFPWLSSQNIDVGNAPCRAARVNFVGELGWELHHPIEYQVHIFDKLMAAGADLGIKPFGIRAMDCLRIEKSYRLPGRELSIEYAALESGLDRFVHLDKGDFLGRDALAAWKDRGIKWAFTTLEVHDTTDADALGSNPITLNGDVVGRCTSGNYGFRLEKSLALAMIRPDLTKPGTELEIEILGNVHRCTVVEESPFDPDNTRLRADG
ncbi:MAG TPA: dimethylglycine dehydrogenase [Rhodospirillaceae bacterium]|nr:dimethylglycine dehydrogenase [Rhodospirillaceae bacterium]HAJ22757.1 dimethylglycine dehydrogenase [Rhodospirillaceae bacterium]|tara:strand:- start:72469 stop:74931 length:2463 start_codon:yes stop_codon:yes gene_type:complete